MAFLNRLSDSPFVRGTVAAAALFAGCAGSMQSRRNTASQQLQELQGCTDAITDVERNLRGAEAALEVPICAVRGRLRSHCDLDTEKSPLVIAKNCDAARAYLNDAMAIYQASVGFGEVFKEEFKPGICGNASADKSPLLSSVNESFGATLQRMNSIQRLVGQICPKRRTTLE